MNEWMNEWMKEGRKEWMNEWQLTFPRCYPHTDKDHLLVILQGCLCMSIPQDQGTAFAGRIRHNELLTDPVVLHCIRLRLHCHLPRVSTMPKIYLPFAIETAQRHRVRLAGKNVLALWNQRCALQPSPGKSNWFLFLDSASLLLTRKKALINDTWKPSPS